LNPNLDNPVDPDLTDYVIFFTQEFADISGSVGMVVDIAQTTAIDSVFVQFFEPEGDIFATLYEFSNDNIGSLIAQTETRSLSGITGGVLEGFAFDCPITLDPGQYFIAYQDPEVGTGNYTFTNYYNTPNRQFRRFDGGAWQPFNNAPIIYPLTSVSIDSSPSSLAYLFNAAVDGVACDYTWDFGDGNTGSGSTVNHVYDSEGDYTVCVVATNDQGEEAETCTDITAVCALGLEEGEVTPSSIELEVSNSSGELTFDWSDGQDTNPAVDLDQGSTYDVTVTDEAGCSVSQSFSTTECSITLVVEAISGSSALATASNTNGNLEFFWQNPASGEEFSTDQAFVDGLSPGNWVVTVVDDSGCSDNTVIGLVSGIDNPGELVNIQIAPNPSNGVVLVSLNSELSEALNIRLFDLQGKLVLESEFDTNSVFSTELNLSAYADGMYLMHFSTSENSFAKRILLSK